MKFSRLEDALWASGAVCHLLVLVIILWKKRLRGLTLFIVYLALAPIDSIALLVVQRLGTTHGYFLTYWITGLLEYLLHLGATVEISRNVLKPLSGWVRESRTRLLLLFSFGTCFAMALALAIGRSSATYATLPTFDRWEIHASIFRSLVICGLVLTTYSIANRFYLQVGRHRIALLFGLFVWSYAGLLVDLSKELFGWHRAAMVAYTVQKFVYLAVLLYWVPVFWKSEPNRKPLPPDVIAQLNALHDSVQLDLNRLEESGL